MFDLVYIVPIIFVLTLIIFFVHKAWNDMRPEIEQEEFLDTDEGKVATDMVTKTLNGFDILLPLVLVLLMLVIALLAYFIDTHPALLFVAIFLFMIILVLAVSFSNIFNEISTEGDMSNETATFGTQVYVMRNLPLIVAAGGMIILIALYGKWKFRGGGGGI